MKGRKPTKPLPSRERLHELFEYRDDGKLIRKVRAGGKARAGDVAGCLHRATGYHRVAVDGVRYQLHRIVWAMFNDHWPEQLDHKDLDKANNRLDNLRPATDSQNRANTPPMRGRAGFKGVTPKGRNRFRAGIGTPMKHIGYFPTAEEAARAYDRAAVAKWGPYARINFPQGETA